MFILFFRLYNFYCSTIEFIHYFFLLVHGVLSPCSEWCIQTLYIFHSKISTWFIIFCITSEYFQALYSLQIYLQSPLSIILIAALKSFFDHSNIWFILVWPLFDCLFPWQWLFICPVILFVLKVMWWRLSIVLYFLEECSWFVSAGNSFT